MLGEAKVLAAVIADREAFDQVDPYLEDRDFTAQGKVILDAVKAYYKDPKAARCDTTLLLELIDSKLGNAKQLDTFKETINNLPFDIGSQNVKRHILQQQQEAAADRLANALSARSGKREEIDRLLDEYKQLSDATDLDSLQVFQQYDGNVERLFKVDLADNRRIGVLPLALNKAIGGGVFPGHTVVLFGRVEMGKSLFVVNAAVGFISQGLKVLFVENEDSLPDTQRRFVQRLIRRPRAWCIENPEEAAREAAEKGAERFILTDQPDSAKDVEQAIAHYEPDVVIINQMRNMAKGEDSVRQLDLLAHSLRRVGKKTGTVMFLVTAAREGETAKDGTIREKPILQAGDVYGAKTGIPAVADLMIGWGSSDEMKRNRISVANIVKNKVVDEGGYGTIYCQIDPAIGIIKGEH